MDVTASLESVAELDRRATRETQDRAATAADWFPDWSAETCAIIATGPSAKSAGVDRLRGRVKIIAIKEAAYDLCPWADVAYGCDAPWWKFRKGLPGFKGLKIGWDAKISYPDVRRIEIQKNDNGTYSDSLIVGRPGLIGSGKNSGFQAFNLAVQFGAKRILLVGFDLSGQHYYGRNEWFKAGNPDRAVFESCLKAWQENLPVIRSLGLQVFNANSSSALRCFPKHSIRDAIRIWGL